MIVVAEIGEAVYHKGQRMIVVGIDVEDCRYILVPQKDVGTEGPRENVRAPWWQVAAPAERKGR